MGLDIIVLPPVAVIVGSNWSQNHLRI